MIESLKSKKGEGMPCDNLVFTHGACETKGKSLRLAEFRELGGALKCPEKGHILAAAGFPRGHESDPGNASGSWGLKPAATLGWRGHCWGNFDRNSKQIGRRKALLQDLLFLSSKLPLCFLFTEFHRNSWQKHLGNVVCA